ncbi:MAG TPA: hypothetical protein V6C76_05320 [Drouetiella sp.]
MCLTGVDYFSTLGYQPGIAFLAANYLAPFATLILVLVTVFCALPAYFIVARESPHGQGSISMLGNLLPGWRGKAVVLSLLGFAATAFIITITLSAADATAHLIQNPIVPEWLHHHDRIGVTLVLLTILGGVFLIGFREAIGVSFIIVVAYLSLNAVILVKCGQLLFANPEYFQGWQFNLVNNEASHGSPWLILATSLLLFPKLALGLSGFETGVAVMPLVKGDPTDTHENPAGRIRNTKFLLSTAALIMCVFLVSSSIATTLMIKAAEFKEGGSANGRALAYLAHKHLGDVFGTVYDFSSILILWFAGASAIAGLLSLVPRYLPRFGMAPEWAAATRPLVVFFTAVAFLVTFIFKADVDAQAGAYATGVLVLITSAAVAGTLTVWKRKPVLRYGYLLIALIFIYTTIVNCVERPEGVHIALFFIATIFMASVISRALRSVELRVHEVCIDATAKKFIDEAAETGSIKILAHRPGGTDYAEKEAESRETHSIQKEEGDFIFLEVSLGDASDFASDCLNVYGYEVDGFHVLRCTSPAIPNAIAALLLHFRDKTGIIPHAYFGWTEGNPIGYIFKYIFFGEGETAPVCREILRELENKPNRRPKVHVG